MTTTRGQTNHSKASMSRVEWAIARYNWYRACDLLDDLPRQTTEIANYQRSADPPPPPPKPHLKWYPLSKPDYGNAATYQQPVVTTQRHRYSQQANNAHPQTFPARGHAEKAPNYDSSTWSRVDWAIARYNWYRACGLLDDLAPPTAETARYRRSPDPPPPKPHLKWYPLNKPDNDVVAMDQRPVTATPPETRRRYCQRVEHARTQAMLARYQAEEKEKANGARPSGNFDPSKHPRAERGQPNGGQFVRRGEEGVSTIGDPRAFRTKTRSVNQARHGNLAQTGQAFFSIPPEKVESPNTTSSLSWLTSWFRPIYVYTDASGNVYANKGSFWGDFKIGYENDGSISREVGKFKYRISKTVVQQFVNENWDIVKEWNEQEWDLYFRIFGQAVARPADAISKGLAQYQQESGIPVPRITPEDKRFYAGMAIFAGITTFIEVGYPIIMAEILSAVFVEALAGEIIAVGVEGGALLITRGKEVIKVGGKQLKEVTEYLVKSGRVKKGAKLDDLGKAFKEFLEEAGQRLTPTQKFKSSNLWDTAKNSKKLRENMGDAIQAGEDAHHIVQSTHKRAEDARKLLDKYHIDINDAVNGVGLKPSGPKPAHHGHGLHSRDAIDRVSRRLHEAVKGTSDWFTARKRLLEELAKLKSEISLGQFP